MPGDAEIGIVITGTDQSSGAFQSASQNADVFTKKIETSGNVMKSLPEKFSKGTAALTIFSGATSQMTGAVGQAATKAAGLASMMAAGGPLGIALAALSAAVAIGSKLWDTYTLSNRNAEAAQRSLDAVIAGVNSRLQEQQERVKALTKANQYFGMSVDAMRLEELDAQLTKLDRREVRMAAIAAGPEILKGYDARVKAIKEEIAALEEKAKLEFMASEEAIKPEAKEKKTGGNAAALHAKETDLLLDDLDRRIEAQKERKIMAMEWEQEKTQEMNDGLNEIYIANLERRAMLEEKAEKAREQRLSMAVSAVATFQNAMNQLSAAIVKGDEKIGKAAAKVAIQTAKTVILAAAAKAAAEAFAAKQWMLAGGLAAGIAAATLALTWVEGLIEKLPKAERGLRVRGGIPGRDSVPVMMQQGEVALDRNQTGLLDRLVSALESSTGGQMQPALAGVGGAGVTQINNFQSVGPLISADTMRATRDMQRLIKRSAARGF